MKPSVGRIVHFVAPNGFHSAAIVTSAARPGNESHDITCTVFLPDETFPAATRARVYPSGSATIKHDEENKIPGTWHWPEREE